MATAPDTHPVGQRPSDPDTSHSDVGSGTDPVGEGPPTRQLDFYQAMHDFKLMFPTMDEDVIEAVLRANSGAVDDTIDQLLTMNVDSEDSHDDKDLKITLSKKTPVPRPESPIYMNQELPKLLSHHASSGSGSEVGSPPRYNSRYDPPSYTDCLTHPAGLMPSKVKPSPLHNSMTKSAPNANCEPLLDPEPEDSMGGSLTLDLEGATGFSPSHNHTSVTSEKTVLKKAMLMEEDFTPPSLTPMPPKMSLLDHDYTGRSHTSPSPSKSKKRYKNWNPPMLGTLPDDFLRFAITPPSTPEKHVLQGHHVPKHNPQADHHSPHQQLHHHHHHHHHHVGSPQRSATLGPSHHSQRSRSQQVARSSSMRGEPGTITVTSSRRNPSLRTVTATHGSEEISSNLIKRKIAENERARAMSTDTMTPEQAQVLEDERLALLSQNEEFLEVLLRDDDFMKTLERDRMNATAFEGPNLDPNRPPPDQIEGYGSDNQSDLGPFPFSQQMPKDNNAEFRRQLSHMGGLSKKKFTALAKKFFTRKKKRPPKNVLKDSTAPSTANLLEDDDTDDEIRELSQPEDLSVVSDHVSTQTRLHGPEKLSTPRMQPFDVV